jgi:hypothetical protein
MLDSDGQGGDDVEVKHAKRNPAIMDEILILPKSPENVSPRDDI